MRDIGLPKGQHSFTGKGPILVFSPDGSLYARCTADRGTPNRFTFSTPAPGFYVRGDLDIPASTQQ
ncbi:hypothetical protein SEA_HOLLIDAY_58 [Gordonia phage Holliday]|nr:hypothetical protein SEA_HOLLIDAY_58 [Gordonia phage Holliday]